MNIFYLIVIVLVALLGFLVGFMYLFNPPTDQRYRYGYRTKYSLMNKENWDLAHQILTISYLVIGLVNMMGVIPLLINFNIDNQYNIFAIVLAIQAIIFISPLIYTELILKHHTKKYNLKNENEHY